MCVESQDACSRRAVGAAWAWLGLCWLEHALSSLLWRSQRWLPLMSCCEVVSRGEWVASLRSWAGFGRTTHLSPQSALRGLWAEGGVVTARSALLAESCRGIRGVCKAPGVQSCAGGAVPLSVLYLSCEPPCRQEPGLEPLQGISLFSHAYSRQIPILPET